MTTARADRRRRILQEGAAASAATTGAVGEPASKVRYTPRPGSASFAVADSVAPRSLGALLGLAGLFAAVAGGLAWADGFGLALATTDANRDAARLLMVDQPASLASWWTAALWAAVATQSVLLFGMRRHRTNDLRGGYRWWLFVAAIAGGMSLNAATHAHAAWAAGLVALTGVAPMGAPALWWLLPAALVLGGVALRSFLELKESPAAAVVGVLAVGATLLGWVASVGLMPAAAVSVAPWLASPLVAPLATMASVSLVVLTLLCYSRRIVLEASGHVAPPTPKAAEPAEEKSRVAAATVAEPTPAKTRPAAKPRKTTREPEPTVKAEATEWVSGGDDYREEFDEAPVRRKLSKAERKRLRKLKARRAA